MNAAEEILYPFPQSVISTTAQRALLATASAQHPYRFNVSINGEKLAVPVRLYGEKLWAENSLPIAQKRFADCLLTRHNDGFARAEALKRVLTINEIWSMPFVVQLVGEYVIEILDQIDQRFDEIDSQLLGNFARENPTFIVLIGQRVSSYWNCYYRHIPRKEYVGFKLVQRIDQIVKTNT